MSYTKYNKSYNSSLEVQNISAPGFNVSQSGISVSRPMTVREPVNPNDVATKAYADSAAGGAGNLQDAYNGGSLITIDTAVSGNVRFRDSGSNPVFTISETDLESTVPLDMGSEKITGLADPTVVTDAATKGYVDTTAASSAFDLQEAYENGNTVDIDGVNGPIEFRDSSSNPVLTLETLSVDAYKPIDMNSNRILDLGAPIDSTDAANAGYVDSAYTTANVGGGAGEVFRDVTGAGPFTTNLRTIEGIDQVSVSNSGDVIQVGWSTGLQIINASTFAGATADVKINAALATADDGAIIVVDDGFGPTETLTSSIVFPAKQNLTIIFGKIEFTFTDATNGGALFDIQPQTTYLSILGAGQGTETPSAPTNLPPVTHFIWDAAAGDAYVINAEDCHFLTVANIRFTGKDQLANASGGIKTTVNTTTGTWGLKLVNVYEEFMFRNMIDIDTPQLCTLENLRLTRSGFDGITLTGGNNNLLSRCYTSSTEQCGIRLVNTETTTLQNVATGGAGVAYLLDGTTSITLLSCGSERNTFKNASYPGYTIQLINNSQGTGIYNLYSAGMTSSVDQVYIDVVSASNTDIINPILNSDLAFIPTNSIVVGVGASGTRITVGSEHVKLPENGANTNTLISDNSTDTILEYDGYFVSYGSRQRGPVFRDANGDLRYLECTGAGAVSGVLWTPPA